MSEAVTVRELEAADLEDVHRFRRAEAGDRTPDPAAIARAIDQSRWYLFDNPEAKDDIPKGFVARDAKGDVVGAKLCTPQRFRCGDESFVLVLGGGYYVNQAFRGVGLRLMRAYLAIGDRYSHFATTMNEVSGAIYERYGGYPIPDTDHEMLGVLRWPPLVEEVLARRRAPGARWLARLAAVRPGSVATRAATRGELVALRGPEDLGALDVAVPPEHAHQLTAARRPDFLAWRYFAGPDSSRHLFEMRVAGGGRALLGASLVPRGHRGQIRALMVLDYWGALEPSGIAVAAALLARRFRDEADVVVFRGQPAPRREQLQAAGFAQRALPRPIGVCIDRAGRLPTREWYLVPADGDMVV